MIGRVYQKLNFCVALGHGVSLFLHVSNGDKAIYFAC